MVKKLFLSTFVLFVILSAGVTIAFKAGAASYSSLFILICLLLWAPVNFFLLRPILKTRGKIAISIVLLLAILLILFTDWFGIFAFLLVFYGGVLFIATGLVLIFLRFIKRYKSPRTLAISLTLILAGTVSILIGAATATPLELFPERSSSDLGLAHLFQTDQADRNTGYWLIRANRDEQRLDYVLSLVEQDVSMTPQDMYYAAFILQHGTCADHYESAHTLATIAAENNIDGAEWISEATYDRWQMALGNSQKYGTQLMPISFARPCE